MGTEWCASSHGFEAGVVNVDRFSAFSDEAFFLCGPPFFVAFGINHCGLLSSGVAQRIRERAGRGAGVVHAPADEPHVAYQAGLALAPRRRAAALHQGTMLFFSTLGGFQYIWTRRFFVKGHLSRIQIATKRETSFIKCRAAAPHQGMHNVCLLSGVSNSYGGVFCKGPLASFSNR